MIKILPIEEVRVGDLFTIDNEPIASINLMERAARRLAKWIANNIQSSKKINIVCGPGNNGGDGLALARILTDKEYHTEVFLCFPSDHLTEDNHINLQRLEKVKEVNIHKINHESDIPVFDSEEVIVDALFGSGLSRKITGLPAKLIDHINDSGCFVLAVDIPSGLYADQSSIHTSKAIVQADYTLTFQFPKLGFLFAENEPFIGGWEALSLRIHEDFIHQVKTKNLYLQPEDIGYLIRARKKFSHKGTFGHALLIAGAYGKMGAATLAAKACLRSGVGLLTTHIPQKGYQIIQTSVPESMTSIDNDEAIFTALPDIGKYEAIGIGPGMGTDPKSAKAMKLLIQNCQVPMLIDADAINILGENKTWIAFLPKNSILTPHPKEFERMTRKTDNDFDQLEVQREFSVKNGIYIVLKGAHTSISCPDGTIYFNSTGNPGMATGGSGDVLSGILLGLMSQGYPSRDACFVGVFLHGLAGDLAAQAVGYDSLIAGDLVDYLGKAFMQLQ